MKLLIGLLLLLAMPAANAAEATGSISWQAPDAYVNGDPLDPLVDLDHYDILVGNTSRNYDITSIEVAPDGTAASVQVTIPGTFQDGDTIQLYMALTATVKNDPATNPAWDGSVSGYSNEVLKTFVVSLGTSPPNPPTNVTATFTITCQAPNGVTCTITATN